MMCAIFYSSTVFLKSVWGRSPISTFMQYPDALWAKSSFLIDLCTQFRLNVCVRRNILLLLFILGIFVKFLFWVVGYVCALEGALCLSVVVVVVTSVLVLSLQPKSLALCFIIAIIFYVNGSILTTTHAGTVVTQACELVTTVIFDGCVFYVCVFVVLCVWCGVARRFTFHTTTFISKWLHTFFTTSLPPTSLSAFEYKRSLVAFEHQFSQHSSLVAREHHENKHTWLLDSGASNHMCGDISAFKQSSLKDCHHIVQTANDNVVVITRKGNIHTNFRGVEVVLEDVFHTPTFCFNLLSVPQLTRQGYTVLFEPESCKIKLPQPHFGQLIEALVKNGLYFINFDVLKITAQSAVEQNINIWHERLGHVNAPYICKLLNIPSNTPFNFCDICAITKSKRKSHSGHWELPNTPLHTFFSDLCGPFRTKSFNGEYYFAVIVDGHTKFTWVFLLAHKGLFINKYKHWVAYIKNRYGVLPKVVHTDGGGEFINNAMKSFNLTFGITHTFSTSHTPTQNPFAERKNRSVQEAAQSIILSSNIPPTFWSYAVRYVVYIQNTLPHAGNMYTTPHSMLHDTPFHMSDLRHIKIFGCEVFAHVPKARRLKGQNKGVRGVFLGYSTTQHGYFVFDIENRKVIISTHCSFNEKCFPYKNNFPSVSNENVERKEIDTFAVNIEHEDESVEEKEIQEVVSSKLTEAVTSSSARAPTVHFLPPPLPSVPTQVVSTHVQPVVVTLPPPPPEN
jgi:hypothetical protein